MSVDKKPEICAGQRFEPDGKSKGCILCADRDGAVLRAECSVVSKSLEYTAVAAMSVQTIREQVEQAEFDLLLTDVLFDDGSGIPLIRDLRRQYPEMPTVIVSSRVVSDDALREMDVCDYLMKPYSPQNLAPALSSGAAWRSNYLAAKLKGQAVAYMQGIIDAYKGDVRRAMAASGRRTEFLQEFLGSGIMFPSPFFYFAHAVLPVMFFREGQKLFDRAGAEGVKVFERAWDLVCSANGDEKTFLDGWSVDLVAQSTPLRGLLLQMPQPMEWNDPFMLAMVIDEREEGSSIKRYFTLEDDTTSSSGKPVLRESSVGNGYEAQSLATCPAEAKAFLGMVIQAVREVPPPIEGEPGDEPPYAPYIFGGLYRDHSSG
jgi:CheY-like chemotaxis protein